MGLTSCDTWPAAHLDIPPVSRQAYQQYKLRIDQSKNIIEQKCVFIDGQDIQLPLTSGGLDPQDNRTYSFYVWAYDADALVSQTLETMREDGSFSLEVVGVKASVSLPDYLPAAGPPQQLLSIVTNGMSPNTVDSMKSHNVLEIRVRSQDITGPFSIVAWFPDKYRKWQAKQSGMAVQALPGSSLEDQSPSKTENPYGEKRDIKVYNGDLRSRIDIVDQREAEASFGREFAKHFYVGRVYLRNRHPDKRMVVYTTSLRANILLYRPPLAQPTPTNSVATGPRRTPMPSWENQYSQDELTGPQRTNLQQRALIDQTNSVSNTALNQAIDQAFLQSAQNLKSNSSLQSKHAEKITNRVLAVASIDISQDDIIGEKIYSSVRLVWRLLAQYSEAAEQEAATAREEAMSIARDELSAVPSGSDEDQVLRTSVLPAFSNLGWLGNDAEIYGHFYAATNAIAKSGVSAAEQSRLNFLARQIFEKRIKARQKSLLAQALVNDSPQILDDESTVPARLEYDQIIGQIREAALAGNTPSPNPFATVKNILMNTDPRALAFSEDSDRQMQMDQVGYLWRDTYRPMTFQAVLNSLMYTDDNTYSARTMKILQAAATIAGGMAGLGTVSGGLASEGYLQGVNFFSTIFVPATGKLIMDDLNKHIRNLGDMGMDTVVIVPPNDVVDHYIFFPKGPIYNFVDEFNVTDPAYIKSIDNDDVAVEATLIDQGVNVQGGGLSAASLTDRALNEGQSDFNSDLMKQADLAERLRRLTLSTTATKIETLLAGTSPAGTNGVKSLKRIQAEKQVCSLVKKFETDFGADTSGTLSGLLSQYNVNCDSSPPVVILNAIPPVDLLDGVPSVPFLLPVDDVMGVWSLQITNASSDLAFIQSTNVQVQLPAPNTAGSAHFTVLAATNAAQNEDVTAILTFTISNTLAQSSTLPIPATVHVPRFQFHDIQGGHITGGTFTLDSADRVAAVSVVLPVYDSDLSGDLVTNWSFNPPSHWPTNEWSFNTDPAVLQKTTASGGKPALVMNLFIDPSMATNQTCPLNISFSYAGCVIASTNLQVVRPASGQ